MKKKCIRMVRVVSFVILFSTIVFLLEMPADAQQTYIGLDQEKTEMLRESEETMKDLSVKRIFTEFASYIKNSCKSFTKPFSALLFITFLTGLLKNTVAGKTALYGTQICICGLCFSVISAVLENIAAFMERINTFILAMLPVMVSLFASSSAINTASLSYSGTLLILSACSNLFASLLIPSVKSIIVFSVVSLLSGSFDFSGFSRFVKNIVGWLFGITMCITSAVFYFQTIVGTTKDGLTARTVRYVASSCIPIIGGVVSESARTVGESLRLVRSVSGSAGIFTVFTIGLVPLAALLVCKIFFLLCGAVSKLMGLQNVSAFYSEICGALNMLLGASIGVILVFILVLGIFASVNTGV